MLLACSCETDRSPSSAPKPSASASNSVKASFCSLEKAYCVRIPSAALGAMVMCKIFSVHPSLSPLAGWSTVSVPAVMAHISQKTVFSRSTRSGIRAATSTPSPAPAVLLANTAAPSRQSGGWPWMSIAS